MSLYPSTDKRPVYLGADGKPLANGKLEYCIVGQTTPKTVYSDRLLTTPATNPQILGIDGRTDTQIFLGVGDYTIFASSFIGLDPNTAPPEDWSPDNQWDESGAVAVSVDPTSVTEVSDIDALRALTPTTAFADVLGYYSAGDCMTRRYRWDAQSHDTADGGMVIDNPAFSTGRWYYISDSDTISACVYGILPFRAGANNGSLQAMSYGVNTVIFAPRSIYLPAGEYEFSAGDVTMYPNVELSQGVTFKNLSASPFTVSFLGSLKANTKDTLRASSSLGRVVFDFASSTLPSDVSPAWYRVNADVDDTVAWYEMSIHLNQNCNVYVHLAQQVKDLMTAYNIDLNCNVIQAGGYIVMTGGTSTKIRLLSGCNIVTDKKKGFFSGDFSMLVAMGITSLRTSLFLPVAGGTTTQDLGNILSRIASNLSAYCTVIYDCSTNSFSTTFSDSDYFSHVREFGRILTTYGINDPKYAFFYNISGLSVSAIGGHIIIGEGETQLDWFLYRGDLISSYEEALNCAFKGNGRLNLNGYSISASRSAVVNVGAFTFAKNVIISNGTFLPASNTNVINVVGGLTSITLDGVICAYTSGNTAALLAISGSGIIQNFRVYNSSVTSTNGALAGEYSGTIQKIILDKSTLSLNDLILNSQDTALYGIDSTINTAVHLYDGVVKLIRCSKNSLSDLNIGAVKGTSISLCDFARTSINAWSTSDSMYLNITDNQFSCNGNTDSLCQISVQARNVNSFMSGVVISRNSFITSGATLTGMHINIGTSGAGTYLDTPYHRIVVIDNNTSLTNPCTTTAGTRELIVDMYGGTPIASLDLLSTFNTTQVLIIPNAYPYFFSSGAVSGGLTAFDYAPYQINKSARGVVDMTLSHTPPSTGISSFIFTFAVYGAQ